MVASGSWDQTVRIWDVDTGENIQYLYRPYVSHSDSRFWLGGAHSPSGDYDAMIHLWNVKTGDKIRTLTGHTSII